MINKLRKTFQQASEIIKDQAATLGDTAKEKSYQIIEDWVEIFPILQDYGLEIVSVGLNVAISPSLEVEMRGEHHHFTKARIQEILDENKELPGRTAVTSVFSTISTTYNLHRRMNAKLYPPLIVKVKVKLSPEINVFIGEPLPE